MTSNQEMSELLSVCPDLVLITPVLCPCSKNFAKSLHVSELFTIFATLLLN